MSAMRRALGVLALAGLAGCGVFDSEEERLPGERIPVRQAAPERTAPPERLAEAAALGTPVALSDWTQPNAVASRAPGHIEGPRGLTEAWRTDVGAGSGDGWITAPPIVADGTLYALDAEATVTALDAGSGETLWSVSVAPEGEDGDEGFGGGLAWLDGRVFAATGFGEVVALGARDGAELWRRDLAAPIRAAPAANEGRVIVVTRDSTGFGLDAATGAIDWRVQGAPGATGVLGGASPATSGQIAVLPFASGELVAVLSATGRRLWTEPLSGGPGLGLTEVTDVAGDPVIFGAGAIASSATGTMVAIDIRNGRRGWRREIGSSNPVWAVAASLFAVDSDARLLRLVGATGETMWSTQLPLWEDPEDRETAIAYGGPVAASGRVYVTSSDGALLAFDAQTGEEVARTDLPGGSITGPVIVGGTLYVLSDDGVVHAFR